MSNQKSITDFSVNTNMDEMAGVEASYWTDMREALERLENGNPRPDDFKKVILDGYFKDFAINQTSLLAMDYTRRSGTRPEILERLVAISNLQDYFITISQLGSSTDDESEDESLEG